MSGFSDVELGDIHNVMTVRSYQAVLPAAKPLISSEVGLSPQKVYELTFEAAVKDGLEISHLYDGVRVYDTGSSIAFMAALAGYSAVGRQTIPMFRAADGTHSHISQSLFAELGFSVRSNLIQLQLAVKEFDPAIQELLKKNLRRAS